MTSLVSMPLLVSSTDELQRYYKPICGLKEMDVTAKLFSIMHRKNLMRNIIKLLAYTQTNPCRHK